MPQNRRLTECLSWLFTVWSPSGDSGQATLSSARSFARMPFRHPTDEAAGKDSHLLAEHRFRHSRSMPVMFDLSGHQSEPLKAAVHPWMLP